MAGRSVLCPLTGVNNWNKVSALIAAEMTAEGHAQLPNNCQSLDIVSPSTNTAGSFLEVTLDPVDKDVAYRIAVSGNKLFESPLRSNNISLLDKWVRLTASGGGQIDGGAMFVLNYA